MVEETVEKNRESKRAWVYKGTSQTSVMREWEKYLKTSGGKER